MATEEKSREERRKEGRKDAGVSAFWQTNASIPGGSSTESVSVSLFLFRSSPTLPPRAPRASQPLFLFLFRPRAQPSPHHSPWAATRTPLCTLLTTENRGPPPSPSPSSTLPGPSPSCCLKPPFSPLLRARPRQTKTNYAAFSEPQRAPTSYTASLPFPLMPPPSSILVYLLPRNSPPTSPNHPHATFLVPAETTSPPLAPRPSPASETPLCRASNGCSTPTHSGKASCPRTTSRLLQPPANFRALSFLRLRLLFSPPPAAERACWLRVIIVDKLGMTSPGMSKLSIPVK